MQCAKMDGWMDLIGGEKARSASDAKRTIDGWAKEQVSEQERQNGLVAAIEWDFCSFRKQATLKFKLIFVFRFHGFLSPTLRLGCERYRGDGQKPPTAHRFQQDISADTHVHVLHMCAWPMAL